MVVTSSLRVGVCEVSVVVGHDYRTVSLTQLLVPGFLGDTGPVCCPCTVRQPLWLSARTQILMPLLMSFFGLRDDRPWLQEGILFPIPLFWHLFSDPYLLSLLPLTTCSKVHHNVYNYPSMHIHALLWLLRICYTVELAPEEASVP